MAERVSNQVLVVLAAAALLVLSGCASYTDTQTTTPPTTTVNETGELTFPDPPTSLDTTRAGEVATQYHLALLAQRLSGTGADDETSLPPRTAVHTTVINRSEGGYYAAVELPEENRSERVPRYNRAMYLLHEEASPRSSYPIRVETADTFHASSHEVPPVDLRIVNFDRSPLSVSVVLTRLGAATETAYVGTHELDAGTGVLLDETLAATGPYRVTVATGNTSVSRIVEYDGTAPDRPIGVYIDPDGGIGIYRGPA